MPKSTARLPIAKIVFRCAWGGFILLLVTVTALAGLLLYGSWEWSKTQRELQQKGEKLFLTELAPPSIPDEENFFAAPIWIPFIQSQPEISDSSAKESKATTSFDIFSELMKASRAGDSKLHDGMENSRRRDLTPTALNLHPGASDLDEPAASNLILESLNAAAPELAELREAAKRPSARYPAKYERGLTMPIPHVIALLKAAQYLSLRIVAELGAGQNTEALEHLRLLFYFANSIQDEPLLINQLVRIAILNIAANVIWEGTSRHAWNEAELIAIQQLLSKQNLEPSLQLFWRGERAAVNQLFQQVLSTNDPRKLANSLMSLAGKELSEKKASPFGYALLPLMKGWFCSDIAYLNRIYQRMVESGSSWQTARSGSKQIDSELEQINKSPQRFRRILTVMSMPALSGATKRFQQAETRLRQAQIACALERYRIANGALPEKLFQLVPTYLSEVPHDVCGMGEFHYRLLTSDRFMLWSIAADYVDDHGTPMIKSSSPSGDWVWQSPLNQPSDESR